MAKPAVRMTSRPGKYIASSLASGLPMRPGETLVTVMLEITSDLLLHRRPSAVGVRFASPFEGEAVTSP